MDVDYYFSLFIFSKKAVKLGPYLSTLLYNLPFFGLWSLGRILRLLDGAMLESWASKNPMLFIILLCLIIVIITPYYDITTTIDDDDDEYYYL